MFLVLDQQQGQGHPTCPFQRVQVRSSSPWFAPREAVSVFNFLGSCRFLKGWLGAKERGAFCSNYVLEIVISLSSGHGGDSKQGIHFQQKPQADPKVTLAHSSSSPHSKVVTRPHRVPKQVQLILKSKFLQLLSYRIVDVSLLKITFIYLFFFFLYVCEYTWHVCATCLQVRGQLTCISSVVPRCEFRGVTSGCQVRLEVPLPADPSCQLLNICFM